MRSYNPTYGLWNDGEDEVKSRNKKRRRSPRQEDGRSRQSKQGAQMHHLSRRHGASEKWNHPKGG